METFSEDISEIYPETLLGFRFWKIDAHRPKLYSIGLGKTTWNPGENTAGCNFYSFHASPVEKCECGLYAYHRPDVLKTKLSPLRFLNSHWVFGAVIASGKVQIHADGFRAEKVQPIAALSLYPHAEQTGEKAEKYKKAMKAISRRYGIKLFSNSENLVGWAKQFGQTIDTSDTKKFPFYPDSKNDKPSVIDSDRTMYWYKNNRLHRDGGPAVITPDGTKEWWRDGFRHREDGPAEITYDYQAWYKNGVYHRDGDKPAIIFYDEDNPTKITSRHWYRNGFRHRDPRDGPAIISSDPSFVFSFSDGKKIQQKIASSDKELIQLHCSDGMYLLD